MKYSREDREAALFWLYIHYWETDPITLIALYILAGGFRELQDISLRSTVDGTLDTIVAASGRFHAELQKAKGLLAAGQHLEDVDGLN